MIGPLIDEKYVGFGDAIIETNINNTYEAKNITNQEMREHLAVPFLISGSMHIVGPILLLFMMFYPKHEPKLTEKKNNEWKGKVLEQPKLATTRLLVIFLGATFLAVYFSTQEAPFFLFSTVFSQKIPLHLPASDAAVILSVMNAMLW